MSGQLQRGSSTGIGTLHALAMSTLSHTLQQAADAWSQASYTGMAEKGQTVQNGTHAACQLPASSADAASEHLPSDINVCCGHSCCRQVKARPHMH